MSYLGRSAKLSLKAQEKVSFLATAGQTSKTGLSYTPTFVEVYVNGVLLTDTTDFTATNGNSVTFTVALLLNDEVTVVSLKTFTVADHYNKTEADTLLAAKAPIASPSFTGQVTADGLVVDGDVTITQSAGGTFLKFDVDGTVDEATISMDTTDLIISVDPTDVRSSSDFIVKTDGSERVRIDSSGHAIIGGGVTLGNGQTYAAANTLDDYEEGSVTLTTSDAVSGGNTGITTTGYYTKIGNQVTLRGNFTNITTTGMTAANPLRIQGLPYASNTSTIGNFGTCKLDNVAFQGGRTYAWVKVGGSSDYVYIQQGGNNISDTSIDVSDINSGVSDFDFQITYTAA